MMHKGLEVTGLNLGASSVSLVTVRGGPGPAEIVHTACQAHEGQVAGTVAALLGTGRPRLAVTGRRFRHLLPVPQISEPQALEWALDRVPPRSPVDAVVSAGGETFILYLLDGRRRIRDVFTGNKCASGTGEFFLQQLERMGLDPEPALQLGRGQEPLPLAGRCSVFCKSDCTHALNKGTDRGRVVAGLCRMMAQKIMELAEQAGARRLLLVGGCAGNDLMVDYLAPALEVQVSPYARCFEALGAALWGLEQSTAPLERPVSSLFRSRESSFTFLSPLHRFQDQVNWEKLPRAEGSPGAGLLLGLDVGSTTTKAVLVREEDQALAGSVYLRTRGDPVGAARRCYQELAPRVPPGAVVRALGVTGSGRRIAALHAGSEAVINEIVAHAAAARHFDPEVDTILEIGGQDAKYTHLVQGVPADYAMNEACAAGTGSFLEEAAWESLEVKTADISARALAAPRAPNFNDQCSAFIGSDIKTAVQEGLSVDEILAGLVYSVCLNYLTRVKGNRPVGRKVFLQGGVCYNAAVPAAMAALLERPVTVPPEPGLMGAYGVALEVSRKLASGNLSPARFSLDELAAREVEFREPFTCRGDADCDRACRVNRLEVAGRVIPFGGACDRYYGVGGSAPEPGQELVRWRERVVLQEPEPGPGPGTRREPPSELRGGTGKPEHPDGAGETLEAPDFAAPAATVEASASNGGAEPPRNREARGPAPYHNARSSAPPVVGINRSLLTHTLFPLYAEFFRQLGLGVRLVEEPHPRGPRRQGAPFCYPLELAHAYMETLLQDPPDYIFLPQVKGLPGTGGDVSVTCPLVQGEPYILKAAFPELEADGRLLSPVLDLSRGEYGGGEEMIGLASRLGISPGRAREAWRQARDSQRQVQERLEERGRRFLEWLEQNPGERAVVIFGRSYNAFTAGANLGIPRKFTSRGWTCLPVDLLPFAEEESFPNMYWANGQMIVQAARLVRRHPQLFGVYITSFSCGPDSFQVGYFRDLVGDKPSLTLELDGHTADAGLDTRVEAFLDIVRGYLETGNSGEASPPAPVCARTRSRKGQVRVVTAGGETLPLDHSRVQLLIPAMGAESNRLLAAAFTRSGVQARALPAPGGRELALGRRHSTCKECLPLQLTVGSLLARLQDQPPAAGEQWVYFMPETSGPCRFGQYQVFINQLLGRLGLENVSTFSLTSENSYGGLGLDFTLRCWIALVAADVLDEAANTLLVTARDQAEAQEAVVDSYRRLEAALAKESLAGIRRTLQALAAGLGGLPRRVEPAEVPRVALLGEIYVRADPFSRQGLVGLLAREDIITRVAPVHEWMYYCDYLLQRGLLKNGSGVQRWRNRLQAPVKAGIEREIKSMFAAAGLCWGEPLQVRRLVEGVSHLIRPELTGEAILTVGGGIAELVDEVDGAIAIGPFGCMPNRLAQAVASRSLNREKPALTRQPQVLEQIMAEQLNLPFMALETDGSAFPQVVQARLESFVLQVQRLHRLAAGKRPAGAGAGRS